MLAGKALTETDRMLACSLYLSPHYGLSLSPQVARQSRSLSIQVPIDSGPYRLRSLSTWPLVDSASGSKWHLLRQSVRLRECRSPPTASRGEHRHRPHPTQRRIQPVRRQNFRQFSSRPRSRLRRFQLGFLLRPVDYTRLPIWCNAS
jgi:hypothetical protein